MGKFRNGGKSQRYKCFVKYRKHYQYIPPPTGNIPCISQKSKPLFTSCIGNINNYDHLYSRVDSSKHNEHQLKYL